MEYKPSQDLLVQSQQQKHQNNLCNLLRNDLNEADGLPAGKKKGRDGK